MSREEQPYIVATDGIVDVLTKISSVFSAYLSANIHILNKYINYLRRVTSLKNERSIMIKIVKKLRFFNDTLLSTDLAQLQTTYEGEEPELALNIQTFASYLVKCLETIDLLNYFLLKPLQKELIAKTLNFDLVFPEDITDTVEDTYNHFVKFTQWSIESLSIDDPLLDIEVVQFSLRCAEEDQSYAEETDNIFLQEVLPVKDSQEYETLTLQWLDVLNGKLAILGERFEKVADDWYKKFGKNRS